MRRLALSLVLALGATHASAVVLDRARQTGESGRIALLFGTNFGLDASPTQPLEALWMLNRLPD